MTKESDLIAAIYDCAFDPSRWGGVVKRIVEATKSVSGALITKQADAAIVTASCNVDPRYADAYANHYRKMDPFESAVATLAPGEVKAGTFLTQTDSFRASVFYNEFFRPQGWAEAVALGLFRKSTVCGYLAFQRPPNAIRVEEPEWHLLETLAPHLRRAAELQQRLARERAITDSLGAAISGAGFAVFLLTGDCRIHCANAKAEDLLRANAGLRCERGRLAAAFPALTHRLRALVRSADQAGRTEAAIGGTIELPRGEDRPALIANVIPLATSHAFAIFDLDRPAAAVFVIDPSAAFGGEVRSFAARFGLTPSETRVLGEILKGKGLPAAAAQLKLGRTTVHTHAVRIFAKTGTRRQTELMRRFFEASLPGQNGFSV
ncbi:MAG: helix-turn-helix transcriptional regulator [Methylocapsa sp.]|nr:helix-turn-helix transcriptional regulator [Methylocapsa sp.]